ncbi:hypothetical protein AS29_008765 [Bacillus sp. SJS]|nr:hypothetical protein AS29_008765 [Bacillus sp. SJS]
MSNLAETMESSGISSHQGVRASANSYSISAGSHSISAGSFMIPAGFIDFPAKNFLPADRDLFPAASHSI